MLPQRVTFAGLGGVVGQTAGRRTKSDTVGLWRYIGRAALELGAHASPAASIAVEKLQANLAPVEGQSDADDSGT